MSSRRFTRLARPCRCSHALHVCRVHEALRTTPAVALGLSNRVWSIGDLLDAEFVVAPAEPTTTVPDRWRRFLVEGGVCPSAIMRNSAALSSRAIFGKNSLVSLASLTQSSALCRNSLDVGMAALHLVNVVT